MVKKLFKHEFIAYLRTLIPVYIILLAVSAFGRIMQFFESDSTVYEIVYGSSVFFFAVAVIVAVFITLFFGVIRFYRNLFTGEGYLSFTLPVTHTQHLLVKSTTAVVSLVMTGVVILVSFCVMTKGPLFIELIKAAGYILGNMWEIVGANVIFYIIEVILLLALMGYAMYLQYYSCITIGQLAKKNRVAASVGVFFGYYVISQVIGTVFMILFAVYELYIPIDDIANWFAANIETGIHILLLGSIVYYAIGGALFFFINRYIMTKKLNLE